jgi:hypothetical protein
MQPVPIDDPTKPILPCAWLVGLIEAIDLLRADIQNRAAHALKKRVSRWESSLALAWASTQTSTSAMALAPAKTQPLAPALGSVTSSPIL